MNFFGFDMYRKTFTKIGGGILSNEARLTAGALAGDMLSATYSAAVSYHVETKPHLPMSMANQPQNGVWICRMWTPHGRFQLIWRLSSRTCSTVRAMLYDWQLPGAVASRLRIGAWRRRHS